MSRFHHYDPEQMYLLPPSVAEVLSQEHLCFHVHRVVEALDVRELSKPTVRRDVWRIRHE